MGKHESKRKVKLRNVVLGSGSLALIMPLVPRTQEELLTMAEETMNYQPDILEWRVDYFDEVENEHAMKEALKALRSQIGDMALMVTPRHAEENGVRAIDPENKMNIFRWVIESRMVDIVDVELRYGTDYIGQIKEMCRQNNCALMVSYHDLERTPEEEEVFEKLKLEQEAGADVCKVSFVAQNYGDIDRLGRMIVKAKEEIIDIPIVSISASPIGTLSRVGGDIFGSDGTFVSNGKTHQIHIDDLRALRKTLELGY